MTLTMNKCGEDEIFYSDDDSDSEISWVSLLNNRTVFFS
jgi:hypothetical protein